MQKGVFSINEVFFEPLSSPAFIGLIGFNCNPPLAPKIKTPTPIISIKTLFNMLSIFNVIVVFGMCFIFYYGHDFLFYSLFTQNLGDAKYQTRPCPNVFGHWLPSDLTPFWNPFQPRGWGSHWQLFWLWLGHFPCCFWKYFRRKFPWQS